MATSVVVPDQMQESLRDKLTGVFVSMEKNLSLQTKTLQGMYRIQKDSFIMEKNRIDDQNRAERFAKNEDAPVTGAPAVQTPEPVRKQEDPKVDGATLGSILTGALGGILRSLPSLILPFIGRVAIGSAIAGFVEGSILAALGATEGDGTWKSQLAKALGTASLMGVIGSLFGKRAALIFAAGGFMYELAAANEGALNEAFNSELSPEFWGMIGGGIGIALAAVLPGLIFRSVAAGLARLRIPPIIPPGANPNGQPPRVTQPGAVQQPRTTPRNFRVETRDGVTRYISNKSNEALRGAAAQTAARYAAMDAAAQQSIMQRAAAAFPGFRNLLKANALIGGLISLPYIASILMDETLDSNQRLQLLAEEIGMLGGGVLGATAGAVGASMIPGVNLGWGQIAGAVGGGIIGSFAGGALAEYIAGQLLGNDVSFDDAQKAEINALARESTTSRAGVANDTPLLTEQASLVPMRVEAKPELTGSGQGKRPSITARANWDRQYGALYDEAGNLRQEFRNDYDRLVNAIINTPTTQPSTPELETPPLEISPNMTQEEILRVMQEYNPSSGPQAVTIVGGGDSVGTVRYQDNRSTNYFISNTNQSIENSLAPFF